MTDLDSLLEDSELRDVRAQFWKRYSLRFPADVHPSDAVAGFQGAIQADAVCSVSGRFAVSNFRWDPPSASAG